MKKASVTRRKSGKVTKIVAFGPKVSYAATSGRIVREPAKPSKIDPKVIYRAVVKVSAA